MTRIGSVVLHRVAEHLMFEMDKAQSAGDWRMAAAYAQLAADAEGRAFTEIPPERSKTRLIIHESQLSLVATTLEYLSKAEAVERQSHAPS